MSVITGVVVVAVVVLTGEDVVVLTGVAVEFIVDSLAISACILSASALAAIASKRAF